MEIVFPIEDVFPIENADIPASYMLVYWKVIDCSLYNTEKLTNSSGASPPSQVQPLRTGLHRCHREGRRPESFGNNMSSGFLLGCPAGT